MRYEIVFDPYARKALESIDRPARRRILSRIEALAHDPRPPGAIMLKGHHGDWRIRVGNWRVIYTIDDHRLVVLVIDVDHRREIYRGR